ncbi:bifunctional homocysteine S-methyltransferase/methylenetetrahydrofolate reductase [Effusibacillus pohliae]|uniref:bifunctional homocysteine S-methyltransferase/methylenetetrahydrofolate reductase n=1 Tax=Effusibacillus pohliae TaxID=232270 RepID=UPI000364CC18|nr:bifunctional homocysteine S-methyltransferase/methylenetetrahydrofolate reductase [Effusibacillus pohliae]
MNRRQQLKARLRSDVLVGDGAIATLFYQQGYTAGSSAEELCLSNPEWVRQMHRAYLDAGARVIETNSFAANREALARYGLEKQTTRINREAVRIARQAVEQSGCDAFVIGSIGSILAGRVRSKRLEEYRDVFEEQAAALLHEGVDGIMLETFYDLEELLLALDVIRPLTLASGTPVITQLALLEVGRTRDGHELSHAFLQLQAAGADMVGLNCRLGPIEILRSLEKTEVPDGLPLSAYPNAGRPAFVDGEYAFKPNADYFGETAIQLWRQGVGLIGGCCGTTPEHIRAISRSLAGRQRVKRQNPAAAAPVTVVERETIGEVLVRDTERGGAAGILGVDAGRETVAPPPAQPSVVELVKQRHTVIVEYDTPRDLDIDKFLRGSIALRQAGADAITMADNSLATARMSNMALGAIIKRELGIEPIAHVACRDRNLIGQQSHLMGLHALGINQILVITGDPARVGDLPGASSVFDVSSFELIRMVKQLNEGVAFSGRPMKHRAQFVVGAAFNPHVRRLDTAVARLERKVEAGADFIMTQPIYDVDTLQAIYEATRHIPVPIFIGIMPLTGPRNAEFLHNEVPGIKIAQSTLERIKRFEGVRARQEGVQIAKELVAEAVKYFKGLYLITPFHYYEMTVELTQYVHQVTEASRSVVG